MRTQTTSTRTVIGALVVLAGLLASGAAVALSCIDGNSERVTYELSMVEIDGEVTETSAFGDTLETDGAYSGIFVHAVGDEVITRLTFYPQEAP